MSSEPEESSSVIPWEPWRCCVCGFMVYNLDEHGNPSPGAPSPRYISKHYPLVCLACFYLHVNLVCHPVERTKVYWTALSYQDADKEEEIVKRVKKLRPGGDYTGRST
jgi:hypothetical protein